MSDPTPADIAAGVDALAVADIEMHHGDVRAAVAVVLRAVLSERDDARVRALVAEWQHPTGLASDLWRRAVRHRLRDQWPKLAELLDALTDAPEEDTDG